MESHLNHNKVLLPQPPWTRISISLWSSLVKHGRPQPPQRPACSVAKWLCHICRMIFCVFYLVASPLHVRVFTEKQKPYGSFLSQYASS